MRPRKSIVTVFVVIATVAAIRAQITSNPIACAGGEARTGDRDYGPGPSARHTADAQARSGCESGRVGASELRPRPSRRTTVRQRFARPVVPARRQEPAVGLHEHRAGLPARDLQPAGKRVHRLRLPPGVREERALLHRARRARAGKPGDTQLHPTRLHREGRHASQRDHGVENQQPGGEHVRGHAA